MDSQTQEMFDQLKAMDQESLNIEQKRFLMARRDYFNDEDRKRYADMIKLHEAGKLTEEVEEDASDLNTLTPASLKEVAKKEGVEVTGLKSKAEFVKAIKAHREAE